MKNDDTLTLTKADEENYHALCAAVSGRQVRRTEDRRLHVDTLTQARKLAMLQRQDYRCADCGREFFVKKGVCPEATLEHVIPFRYGSAANPHNTLLVCLSCNVERDKNFSLATIEHHYGPVDLSKVNYVPVVRFQTPAEINQAAWRSWPRDAR